MFVISMKYTVPIEVIDQALPAHLDWIRKHIDDGRFLAAGRKIPATGGIIVTRNMELAEVEELLTQDPFVQNNLAEVDIIEFAPRNVAPLLLDLVRDTANENLVAAEMAKANG